ncbi:hypothetical protein [Clostridium polynesiense]|uniref:hypothetical protein n=1 Tax=Clostridium polynesiense TaxID=1325933 RepID=UPI00058FE255|nr:hypothetical protein [Clostridium polynesiense]
MNSKKILIMIVSCIVALNIGVTTAIAAPPGNSESLTGKGKDEIETSTGSGDTKVNPDNGKVDVELGGSSKNPPSSNKPGSSTGSNKNDKNQNSNKKPGSSGQAGKPGGQSETIIPGGSGETGGSSGSEIPANPEWSISEGWTWSLSEWGNRNNWFSNGGNGGGDKPWYDLEELFDRAKTVFWGGKDPVPPVNPEEEESFATSESSHVSKTGIRKNKKLVKYDWTIRNKTDSSVPVETASTKKLNLKWTARYTGDYEVIAKPLCSWDVGYETTHKVTITSSKGKVVTKSYTQFHKTHTVTEYYTPGIRKYNFKISLKDLNKPFDVHPPKQVQVDAIDELVE